MKNKSLLRQQVSEGLNRAHKKMIAFKKKNNSPIVISENGKVVLIPAEELE